MVFPVVWVLAIIQYSSTSKMKAEWFPNSAFAMYRNRQIPHFDTNAFNGANQRKPQCLCGFIALGVIIPHSSILLTIPVAFIYKSPLISNRDTIICQQRRFILTLQLNFEFTFSQLTRGGNVYDLCYNIVRPVKKLTRRKVYGIWKNDKRFTP